MARRREQRLRKELHAVRRKSAALAELGEIANAAIRYIHEIYNPDLREPYSIANRRDELKSKVFAYRSRRGMTRKP